MKVIEDVRDVRDTSPRCAIFNGETFDDFLAQRSLGHSIVSMYIYYSTLWPYEVLLY